MSKVFGCVADPNPPKVGLSGVVSAAEEQEKVIGERGGELPAGL